MCPTIRVGSEWAVNIQWDSYTSYIGHTPLLSFFGIAENESVWSGAMHLHAESALAVRKATRQRSGGLTSLSHHQQPRQELEGIFRPPMAATTMGPSG